MPATGLDIFTRLYRVHRSPVLEQSVYMTLEQQLHGREVTVAELIDIVASALAPMKTRRLRLPPDLTLQLVLGLVDNNPEARAEAERQLTER